MFRKLALLAALALSAQAAIAEPYVFVLAPESGLHCGQWVNVHAPSGPEGEKLRQAAWLAGILSGFNLGGPVGPTLTVSAFAGYEQWMTQYCTAHPLEETSRAAFHLFAELVGRITPKPAADPAAKPAKRQTF